MAFTMPDTRTYTADFDYSPLQSCVVFAESGAQAFVQALRSRAISALEGRGDERYGSLCPVESGKDSLRRRKGVEMVHTASPS